MIRYRGKIVAEHAVLEGRSQPAVRPEHGPGAAARNARQRYGKPRHSAAVQASVPEVEIRDLAIYDQLSVRSLSEAA